MKDDLNNEIELLRRLKSGDTNAYLRLYDKYHPVLYTYVISFLKIPELAEDILQEVFIKIWEIRERINPDLSFQAYIYRISRNSVFKQMKKIARDEELRIQISNQINATVENADLKLQWQQYEKYFQTAVDQLPAQRQRVFRLCRQEGKSYEEVAQLLGITRNTVKEHMVLAVKSIKDFMHRHADIQFTIMVLILKTM